MFHSKTEETRIFKEACKGFGFEQVEQHVDGRYCSGCMSVHKRPTKMYSNDNDKNVYCRYQLVRLFNPEEY